MPGRMLAALALVAGVALIGMALYVLVTAVV